jgi:hypothetical protein
MLKRPGFVVVAVSIVLLLYCIMIVLNLALPLVYFIFSISPFLLCWLAYSIIRFGKFTGKEFTDQQEWGYQDRQE